MYLGIKVSKFKHKKENLLKFQTERWKCQQKENKLEDSGIIQLNE